MSILHLNCIKMVTALAAVLTIPAAGFGDEAVRAKRVWTNDDFKTAKPDAGSSQQSAPQARPPEPAPAPKPVTKEAEASDERAKLLATAVGRGKAFDQTILSYKAKMEKETDAFRRETYQSVISDALTLQQNNQKLIDSLAEKQEKTKAGNQR